MEQESLFIRIRGRIQGPFDLAQLQELTKQGRLGRLHEVSEDGTSWKQASDFPSIFARDSALNAPDAESKMATQHTATSMQADAARMAPPRQGHTGSLQRVWYHSADGLEKSAIDFEQLKLLVAIGQIGQNALVWTDGMSEWLPVKRIPQLSNVQAVPVAAADKGASDQIARPAVNALVRTRPWVIFIAVFGFIVVGLTALSGLWVLSLGVIVNSTHLVLNAGISFMVMTVYFIVSYLLLRYGMQISRFQLVPTQQELQAVLRAQYSFWRTAGYVLLTAIVVCAVWLAVLVYLGAIAFDALRAPFDRNVSNVRSVSNESVSSRLQA